MYIEGQGGQFSFLFNLDFYEIFAKSLRFFQYTHAMVKMALTKRLQLCDKAFYEGTTEL